tara:strand:- start:28 stop:681 length:654 start_codon:yes stop_codon:yes gene_type:complete
MTSKTDRININLNDPYSGKQAYGLFSNLKLEIYSLFSLACLGILFKIFFPQKNDIAGNEGPATVALWGYGLAALCLLCILFISYGLSKKELMESKKFNKNIKDGFFSNIRYILGDGDVYFIVIKVLVLLLILNYGFYKKINVGIIPESYNRFSYVSNLIIFIQFIILGQYINLTMFKNEKKSSTTGIIAATSYFLCTANIIFVIIMYILLKYYSTDG